MFVAALIAAFVMQSNGQLPVGCPLDDPAIAPHNMGMVKPGASITLTWMDESSPDSNINYSAIVDSVIVKNWARSELTITAMPDRTGCYIYTATFSGLTPGEHRIKVRSYPGSDTSKDFSETREHTIYVSLSGPRNLRIVLPTAVKK